MSAALGAMAQRLPRLDPRLYQIAFQAVLLSFGVLARDFTLRWEQMMRWHSRQGWRPRSCGRAGSACRTSVCSAR